MNKRLDWGAAEVSSRWAHALPCLLVHHSTLEPWGIQLALQVALSQQTHTQDRVGGSEACAKFGRVFRCWVMNRVHRPLTLQLLMLPGNCACAHTLCYCSPASCTCPARKLVGRQAGGQQGPASSAARGGAALALRACACTFAKGKWKGQGQDAAVGRHKHMRCSLTSRTVACAFQQQAPLQPARFP